MAHGKAWWSPVLLLASLLLRPAAAAADPVSVDWKVVPRYGELEPTPYYECYGDRYAERRCQYLWEKGIELHAVFFSFYDDKWFDGFGIGVPESQLPDAGVLGISPRCEPGLAPCFGAFTPMALELSGYMNIGDPPSLFVTSSKGGLVKLPFWNGTGTVRFDGPLWEAITWMEVGFFTPMACEADEPPDGLDCRLSREKALVVESLTFEAVPEPSALLLLSAGLPWGAARWRRRRDTRPEAAVRSAKR